MNTLKSKSINNLLKSVLIVYFLLGCFITQGQNAFDQRSTKSNSGKQPSFLVNTIQHKRQIDNQNFPFRQPVNHEGVTIITHPEGQALMIKGNVSALGKAQISPDASILSFLNLHADILPIANPSKELQVLHSETDALGTTVKYGRKINGIEVFGAEIMANMDIEGNVILTGNILHSPYENPEIKVSASRAQSAALEAIGPVSVMPVFDDRWNLAAGQGMSSKLNWASVDNHKLQQVYIVDYFPNYLEWYRVWVDAQTGLVLRKYNKTCSVDGPKTASGTDLNGQSQTLNTYQVGSMYYMIDASKTMFSATRSKLPSDPVGAIWTIDAQNTDGSKLFHVSSFNNTWSDKSAVSAHVNAGIAFDYYKNTHGRNSINGSGGTIISVVNVTENGSGLDNAYWNGQSMFYGNGKSAFKPLAGSLDVAGHEMTHGVISSTANLEYYSQPGAINESMADIFGAMMDRDDWKMGEDVVKTSVFTSGALRDLSDPHNGGTNLNHNGYQPKKMSEYYTGEDDNQGVHINSGIPNYAYYLVASAITKEKAEKIYYRALTKYLTSSSNFLALRYAVVQAATDLYGAGGTEVSEVKKAFDAVEIYDPNAGSGSSGSDQEDLAQNNGTEFILSTDVDPTNTNTLYQSSTSGTNFKAISKTALLRRPSVVDDGSYCVFVADDNNIHQITLKGTLKETPLTSDAFWENVAISKDGKRLAGVSTEIDSAIYVYDFTTQKWSQFNLYNPTFSSGINAGGVLYADAIEFDYSGEYILYDAYNKTKGATGVAIDYWDIGIIRVWDNSKNTWGDGKVKKLFSQLPADVSIGNPTYAKNSPYIVGFDYIDEFAGTYSVLALNTATGKVGTVYNGTKLGYPSYSNKDDKIIFDASSSGVDVVGVRSLDASKIVGTGTPALLITDAKWGVWYADGTRTLLSDKKDILSFTLPSVSGAKPGVIVGNIVTVEVPVGTNVNGLIPTFTLSSMAKSTIGTTEQTSGVTINNYTNAVNYTIKAQNGSTKVYQVKVQSVTVGVHDIENRPIKLYPNPTDGKISLSGIAGETAYVIYSIEGKLMHSGILIHDNSIDVFSLPAGLYSVKFEVADQNFWTTFVKQ